MGILQEMGNEQGYLKAGFFGFAKSGKTYTASKLACGMWRFVKSTKPIAFFDTEGGASYVADKIIEVTGRKPVGVRSRSFDTLIDVVGECEAGGSDILLIDSITHVWRELCDSYLYQLNEAGRRRLGSKWRERKQLEFEDQNVIKPKWWKWTDLYLNSRLHIIMCGRGGFEWDREEDEKTGKKNLVKTGTKMKVENEAAFEPSLLVEMERERDEENKIIHRATVIGDRYDVLDGAECINPGFDFFRPHLEKLKIGSSAPIDTETRSDHGIHDLGDSWSQEKRQRKILSEEIEGLLRTQYPSQGADDKKARQVALDTYFGTHSWTRVSEATPAEELRKSLTRMRQDFGVTTRVEPIGDDDPLPEWPIDKGPDLKLDEV